ncbi:MAG: NUDIX hydrolase [Pseudomonadota bacterium]
MTQTPARWRIASARTMYDNPWIRVREYEALAPTGAPARYGLVEMKNLSTGVLPVESDGTTYLVGQDRFAFGRYSWELPEGGGPKEDDPKAAAARELAEETGFQAASWLTLMEDVHLSNSVTDERAFAFLAWGLSPIVGVDKDAVEDLALRRLPFGEALRMAADGEISDVFSLVMLFKTNHLLQSGALPSDVADALKRGL